MSKLAVVLFNLGGPDKPEAVEPFLFNLFNDPAIIGAPGLVRRPLARFIARRRAPVARDIYARLGGGSPILVNTQAQARSLEMHLRLRNQTVKVFVSMRYWHPFADDAARAVAAFAPDRIVLLPLYPQYSSTTTASSLGSWHKAARKAGLTAETRAVCCYPAEKGFVLALAEGIRDKLDRWNGAKPRILFSAHGLPKKVIKRGDPYQWQVERTAGAVMAALAGAVDDWVVCYQSRVGPLEWIGPSTEQEIRRAGADGVPVFVVPLSFVSEHSETLVELDIEYRHLADEARVPGYVRVPTVSANVTFIDGLADLVERALERPAPIATDGGLRICPAGFAQCEMKGG
ncbi:MAG: ferrochelatase [Rhodospirillaceae bacterium]|nr:ferrochelatase [Rhodospirillaceae bacterium]